MSACVALKAFQVLDNWLNGGSMGRCLHALRNFKCKNRTRVVIIETSPQVFILETQLEDNESIAGWSGFAWLECSCSNRLKEPVIGTPTAGVGVREEKKNLSLWRGEKTFFSFFFPLQMFPPPGSPLSSQLVLLIFALLTDARAPSG